MIRKWMEFLKNKTKELAATKEPAPSERKTTAELRDRFIISSIFLLDYLFLWQAISPTLS